MPFKCHNRGVHWLNPGRPHPKVKHPTCSRWARGNWPGSHCFSVLLKMAADRPPPEPWSRGRSTRTAQEERSPNCFEFSY